VLNELTLDLQFDRYKSSEQALAFKHLKFLPKQASAIVLMDRGYRDSTLWGALNDRGANILVRLVKTSSMVKELKRVNFKRWEYRKIHDLTTTYHPPKSAQKKHGSTMELKPLPVRVIACRRPGKQSTFFFMTTLLDVEKYPAKALIKLYQSRWMIEEDIRVKKCRSEIENFSGCSV